MYHMTYASAVLSKHHRKARHMPTAFNDITEQLDTYHNNRYRVK